jgi:urate oxidase / 2-oxo-4-hydroxy-4-carboxy-5-ureidoimidazoline decarboxylase
MAEPVGTHYGKDAVSVYRTEGKGGLFAAEVKMLLEGEALVPSYTEGDNSLVVATDSMKNFIHACALEHEGSSREDFLDEVARRFLERYEQVEAIELTARELPFAHRRGVLFQRTYDDRGFAWLRMGRDGVRDHRSGREGLHLVKLTGSSFAGFVRDEYTTLPEAADRPLFVHLNVYWQHAQYDKRVSTEDVRDLLVTTFEDYVSASIQQLVHEMGMRALDEFRELEQIVFDGQNRLWDTAQTKDEIAVYTDARPPFGTIYLALKR